MSLEVIVCFNSDLLEPDADPYLGELIDKEWQWLVRLLITITSKRL